MSGARPACRVCLRPATVSVDSSRIFGDTALTVRQLLHLYTTAQFNESWLPQSMCEPCVKHLENCHIFNEKYTETHRELSHRFKHVQPKKSLPPILSRTYLSARNSKEIKLLPKTPLIINKYGIEVARNLTPKMSKLSPTHIAQKKNVVPVIAIGSIAKPKHSLANITGSVEAKSRTPVAALEQFEKTNHTTANMTLDMSSETTDENITLNIDRKFVSSEHEDESKSKDYCRACQLKFYSTMEKNRHNEEYHFLRIRMCVICNKTFTSEKLLEKHKLTHEAGDAEVIALINEDDLTEAVGGKDGPFDNLELVREGPLFKYVEENTQFGVTKKVQCKLCGSIFKSHTSYLQHRSVHKSNVCWRCNRGWSTRTALLAHVATHAKFDCVLCACSYASRTSLHTHYRRHHRVTAIPYFCGICEDAIEYSHLCDLLQHLKVHNTSENDAITNTSIEPANSEKIEQTNIEDPKHEEIDDKNNIITDIDIDLKKDSKNRHTNENLNISDFNSDKIEKPTDFETAETIEAELTVNLEEAVNFFNLADLQNKSYVLKVEDYIERGDTFIVQDLDRIELLAEEYTKEHTDILKDTAVIEEIKFDNDAEFEKGTHTEEQFQKVQVKEEYSKEVHSEAYFLDEIHKELENKEGKNQLEGAENFADEPEIARCVSTHDLSISSDHTEEQLTEDGLEVDEEMDDQDTATVHYYVVDDENGDNLVEITADQAQLLVNGETLEPRFDEKEGLLTDHSLVLESISPTPDLNQLFESKSDRNDTSESQPESPETFETQFRKTSETQSKFQETYETQSELQESFETQSDLQESFETQSELQESFETQSELHKTYGTVSELQETSKTQSEPKGTAETQSETCRTAETQPETKTTFRPKRNPSNSLETESGPKNVFPCQLCDVVVTRKYNLMRHLAVAHERYTLRCSRCEKKFNNVSLYEVHKMNECRRSGVPRKQGNTNNNPTCPVCGERFKKQHLVLRHIEDKHGDQISIDSVNQRYLCKICDKTYHMEKHSGVPRYACQHCFRRFTSNPALLNHVAGQHTDKRPHLCQQCGRGFVSSDHLRKHLRLVHGGRRDYLCVECGLTFQQASHVKQHQWVHTGVKPYSCKYCQGRFSSTSAMKKHISRLHNAEHTRDLALQEVEYRRIEREQLHKMAATTDK